MRDGPDPRIAKMDEIHKGAMSMISNVQAVLDEINATILADDEVNVDPSVTEIVDSLDRLTVELTKAVAYFTSIPGTLASTKAAITTTGNTIGPHIVAGSGVIRPPPASQASGSTQHNPTQPPSRPSFAPLTLSNPPSSNFVRPNMRSVSDSYTGNLPVRPAINRQWSSTSSAVSPITRPQFDSTYQGAVNYVLPTDRVSNSSASMAGSIASDRDTDTLDFDANSVGMSDLFDQAMTLDSDIAGYGNGEDTESVDEFDELQARINRLQEPSIRFVPQGMILPSMPATQAHTSAFTAYQPPVRPLSNVGIGRPSLATTSSSSYRRPMVPAQPATTLPSRPIMQTNMSYVPIVRPRPVAENLQVRPYNPATGRPSLK
ncbi:UNVERIFIED_CONTAM: hypothetical protein HDU68_009573 [Siphonaria sp. JEL0065]|nr:hypothetical protein HDU68_009573 [Siphonaria sp. JEL0065]